MQGIVYRFFLVKNFSGFFEKNFRKMLEIFNKISENLPPQNVGTPCVPHDPYPSDLALLDLTLFGESRQFRPYPPFGYLTNDLINLEKAKSQFGGSWFKCAYTYLSHYSLGFSPAISCVDFLKSISVFPLSKCVQFYIPATRTSYFSPSKTLSTNTFMCVLLIPQSSPANTQLLLKYLCVASIVFCTYLIFNVAY